MNIMAQWEDEANYRQIHFSVDYSVNESTLEINRVTPDKVTIIDPINNAVVKSMGVHTEKGRQLLTEQFAASGKLEEFTNELARRNGLLVAV